MRNASEATESTRDGARQSAGTRKEKPLRGPWIVWGVGALCYFIALFHRTSLGVVAPEAMQRFGAGPALLSLFSALQLGVYLALQVPSGLLADRLGPRKVITVGVVALALGSAIFGISVSTVGGITGRMLIGIGDAFMFTNVLRLAAHWFPAHRFGKVAALTGLIGGLGQLVSTVPLSASLQRFGWNSTFIGGAVLTSVAAVVAVGVIRDRPGVRADEHGRERTDPGERVSHALRIVVALRGTWHSFCVHFVLMAQFAAMTTLWGSPWLRQAQGQSAAATAAMLMLCVLGFVFGAWLAGQYLAGRIRRRETGALWASCAVVVVWLVMVGWPGSLPLPMLLVVLVVVGAGGGVAMLAFDGARSANATHRAGAASGVVNMGGFSGAVLIELVVGLVLQMARGLPAGEAYRWAFLPVIAVLAAGVFAQMALRTPRDSGRSSASLARPLGETDRVGDRR